MSSALLVRFRPAGPWRLGSDSGARTQTGTLLHSDTLYSAITLAMRDCDWLDEWIAATATASAPAVRISSGYPFTGSTLLVQPPRTVWPPAQSGKLRWKTARFVPVTLVPRLLAGEVLSDEEWAVDPSSECLLPVVRNSVPAAPFRKTERVLAPVDRVSGTVESVDRIACLQFAQGSGIWFMAAFTDDEARSVWAPRMRSVARLLADTGIGGGRSRGWGRSREPQFGNVDLPEFFTGGATAGEGEAAWWLLSQFIPADGDAVDWERGSYAVVIRGGRTDSGELKAASRVVAEGSVILSGTPPAGTARNVASAESPHPVYRSGIALAVPVPYFEKQRWELMEHAAPVPAEPPAESAVVADEIPVGVDAAGEIVDAAAEELASAEVGTGAVPGEDLAAAGFEPAEDTPAPMPGETPEIELDEDLPVHDDVGATEPEPPPIAGEGSLAPEEAPLLPQELVVHDDLGATEVEAIPPAVLAGDAEEELASADVGTGTAPGEDPAATAFEPASDSTAEVPSESEEEDKA